MSTRAETHDSRLDVLKWIVVAVIVFVGVAGNHYFAAESVLYRAVALVALGLVAGFVALQTAKGKAFWSLLKEARIEIRKVVWPTRTETTQTTLIVVAVVLIMALVLCGLDTLLGWIISMFIGYRCSVSKRWYVIHAYSGFEKHVMRSLQERIKLAGMEDQFGEILVPTEEVVEMRSGQKRKSERKFFPGYVLVQMEMNEGTWHLVKDTPRVLGFIGGTADKPAPISDREAEAILRRVADGSDKPKPKTLFEPGEVVRVIDGPFADFNGVVEEVNYEKSRVQVAVLIFGRPTPVELEFGQVEKG